MHDEIHKYVNLWDEKMNVSKFWAATLEIQEVDQMN